MKKTCLAVLAVFIYHSIFAQTPPTNTVQINGSYVTNTFIDVHPYLPLPVTSSAQTQPAGNTANTSGNPTTPPPVVPYNPNITFRLNKGAKFFVDQIISDGTTITGYVITAWYYKNSPDKTNFYQNLNQSPAPATPLAQAQQAVATQQLIVKANAVDVDTKTKELATDKASAVDAQNVFNNAKTAFYSTSLYYHADVPEFKAAQTNALLKESSSQKVSSDEQDKLIQESLKLSDLANSAFTKLQNAYTTAKNDIDKLKNKIVADDTALTSAISKQKEDIKKLHAAQSDLVAAQSPNGPKTIYNITKFQVGMPSDDISDADNPAAPYDKLAYIESWANGWKFYMSAKDFATNTTMIYPYSFKFTWGFLTLPLKLRFDNPKKFGEGGEYTFEQNLNFGLTFGFKQQWKNTNDISMNYLVGISVVNVPLNDAQLPSTANPNGVAATSTTAASVSTGVMFQYAKFQIGIFGGLDYAGAHADQFPFQGRPWLGFAIGVSLFGEGQTSANPQNQ